MEANSIHYGTIVGSAAALISAVASVALVLIALLFRGEVRAARRRPNLRLLFDPASTTDSIIITINSREECWFRFRARNEVGREVAAGVQLLLLEARREDAAHTTRFPCAHFRQPT